MAVVSGRSPGNRTVCASISLALYLTLIFAASAEAGTVVRISTSLGDYSIELLDDVAPGAVQNFLNYVNRNDYDGTYIHRAVDNFVVQGGGFRFQLFEGPVDVPSDPPIRNEFNVSNTRRTVAMAKIDGDPNSATNQWFVNLVDNSLTLDTSNGGFTVFGTVPGEGMTILDAIDALPFVSPGGKAPNAPYITELYNGPRDFVYISAEVTERFSAAPHSPNIIIQVKLESVIPRRESFEGMADYSSVDGRLRIPALEVNLNGSVGVVSNVVFVLSDAATASFTLASFDQ